MLVLAGNLKVGKPMLCCFSFTDSFICSTYYNYADFLKCLVKEIYQLGKKGQL